MPTWLIRWGNVAWRLIAIGIVVFFGFRVLRTVSVVVLATVAALFLAAVLWRPARWLADHGWPLALASLSVLAGALSVLVGVVLFIVPQIASSFDELSENVSQTWASLQSWLIDGPLGLSEAEIDSYLESLAEWAQGVGQRTILGGATAVVEAITGTLLAVIITFFLLKDGRNLLDKLLSRLPDETASKVDTGFTIGRKSLAQYMGGIAVIGAFDAVLIGVALWIVGAPLVLPLALLVFFGAFIPLVGAFVSGLLAVAVTFVNGGLTDALIILAVAIGVQQFEGDVVMPLVFGQTLRLHPLVILLGVTAGGLAFGLFGAFLAVPLIAVGVSINEAVSDDPESGYISLARG